MTDTNHVKPTSEELEAGMLKAAEEAEALKTKPPEENKDPIVADTKPDVEPDKGEPEPDVTLEKSEPDYKKKFTESTREAQILHAKNSQINSAYETAMKLSDPSEEEMKQKYPQWDDFDETTKMLSKENLLNTKRFQILGEVTKESKNIEAWNEKVDTFVGDPKTLVDNPDLEGKAEEFKQFATKPSRRGVDFETLVSAFIGDGVKNAKPKSKGKMFETGSAGPSDKGKTPNGKISIEQGRALRESNYSEYSRMLKAGLIESLN